MGLRRTQSRTLISEAPCPCANCKNLIPVQYLLGQMPFYGPAGELAELVALVFHKLRDDADIYCKYDRTDIRYEMQKSRYGSREGSAATRTVYLPSLPHSPRYRSWGFHRRPLQGILSSMRPGLLNFLEKVSAAHSQPQHEEFLDEHFSVTPQWKAFRKKLKAKSFVEAVKQDTRSDEKLKRYSEANGKHLRAHGVPTFPVPSQSSGKSYTVKYHPDDGRFHAVAETGSTLDPTE
jgi:hypothetical protein